MKFKSNTIRLTLFAASAVCLSLLLTATTRAAEDIDITTSTTITAADDYATVNVYDKPPEQTVLTLEDTSIDYLFAYDSTIIHSFNTDTRYFFVMDNTATADITGGSIDTLFASGQSNTTINSCVIDYIQADGQGRLTIDDVDNDYGLVARDQAILTVNGGEIMSLGAEGDATVNIRGGNLTGVQLGLMFEDQPTMTLIAGDISYFTAVGDGELHIIGYDFAFTPDAGQYNCGRLTGRWQDDTPFTIDYFNSYNDFAGDFQIAAESVTLYLPGDADGDLSVSLLDLDILGRNYNSAVDASVSDGDFNADGKVTLLDLDILGRFYGQAANAIPEPASAALLLTGGIIITRRTHGRNANRTVNRQSLNKNHSARHHDRPA